MNPYYYYNGAGQRFPLPERAPEPPNCFEESLEASREECDKEEE